MKVINQPRRTVWESYERQRLDQENSHSPRGQALCAQRCNVRKVYHGLWYSDRPVVSSPIGRDDYQRQDHPGREDRRDFQRGFDPRVQTCCQVFH